MACRLVGRRAGALLLAVATLVVVGPGVGDPAAAAETVKVVWPAITQFNPETTDYTIEISYDGDGYLFLSGGDWENSGSGFYEPLPSNGTHEVNFPYPIATVYYLLAVTVCPTPEPFTDECRLVALGPQLTLYSAFRSRLYADGRATVGPAKAIKWNHIEPTPDGPVDVVWEVAPPGPQPVPILTGVVHDVSVDEGFVLSDPLGKLPMHTPLSLKVEVTGEAAPYGSLYGRNYSEIEWDPVNGAHLTFGSNLGGGWRPSVDAFYPADDDGYGDAVRIGLANDRLRSGDVTIENTAGDVVFTSHWSASLSSDIPEVWWRGRDQDGVVLPEGRYAVTFNSTDVAGNVGVAEGSIRLSHAQLEPRYWDVTLTPEETFVLDRSGQCGWIEQSPRDNWPGSIGLYTSEPCPKRGYRFAHAVFRFPLPRAASFDDRATIIVRGRAGYDEPDSTLSVRGRELESRGTRWVAWETIPGWSGGREIYAYVLGNGTRRPSLFLGAATYDGDRFDLKNFTVRFHYVALVE